MTEEAWKVCSSPYEMLKHLATQRPSSQRKWLLFGAACCRRVWHTLVAEHSHYCVELAEEYADGHINQDELERCPSCYTISLSRN